ncbi:AMP-binding protein [Niveispirillum fermenti]|uniref:AMP-binding protein n=1 Tax=Niveispirillum fermenti TaxID=1233113 RepID=UPI003A8C6B54
MAAAVNLAPGGWTAQPLAALARQHAARTPDAVAFLNNDQHPGTYAALLTDAEALAVGLWDLGLRPGDVISFQLPNWMEAVLIDIAAGLLGLVCNPIVPIYRGAEVGLILADCKSRLIFIPDTYRGFDYAAMLDGLRPSLPDLRHVVQVRAAQAPLTLEGLIQAGRGRRIDWPRISADALKLVMYTSGTTGRPKAVRHDHRSIARVSHIFMGYWGLAPGDLMLMPSPVTHITGYSNGIELPFTDGTRTLFMERWNADEAVSLIDRHGVNVTIGATPFLQELLDAADRAGSRLPSLKIFACGGAAVPPGLIRRANALFDRGRAFRVYGSTEAPLITQGCMGADEAELAATTDGKVIDYDIRIVDEAGQRLEPGQDGEILVRGPSLFMGYADEGQTREAMDDDGYFRTGDIGHLTPAGAIVITGRKKDLIIRGGENLSAKDIEDVLHRHPGIQEVAAVAMPHARLGETVCVYVVPQPGERPDLDGITRHVAAAGLARQKFPERVELVTDLPRTASGKVRKDILRQRIAARIAQEQGGENDKA